MFSSQIIYILNKMAKLARIRLIYTNIGIQFMLQFNNV